MKKKKKKISFKSFNRILTILLILVIYLIVLKIGNKEKEIEENVYILYNNISYNPINEIYIDVLDEVYFSITDVKNLFDENITYYENEKMLVSTYNMHILEMKLDECFANINGTNMEIQGALKYVGNTMYLPVAELGIVYDYDFSYNKENKIIMIDSQKNEKKVTTISKDTKLLKEEKTFSKKIKDLVKDTVVTVIADGEKYKKIRTDDGFIGYIKAKNTSETTISREQYEEVKKELNVLWEYTEISKINKNIETKENAVNIIIPEIVSFYNSTTNKIRTNIKDKNKEKIKFATEQNIQLMPYLTDKNIENLSEVLDDYNKRKEIINEIITDFIQNDFGGITINFSNVNQDNIKHIERFLIELKPYLKEYGKKLIINKNSNYTNEIYEIADYTIEK